MNPPPIRVLIVNDHRCFADAVTALLDHETNIALAGSTTPLNILNRAEALEPCDVVLLETSMEGLDAAQVTMQIKRKSPETKVIVLGIQPEEETILRFIEAGASGYILQDASFHELLHTIQSVYQGQTICSPRIVALVFARIAELSRKNNQRYKGVPVRLTPREYEVLQLLAHGCQNGEIAEELGIALHTVKSHIHNLLDKLQVSGRREAIELAYAYNMLPGVNLYPYPSSSQMQGTHSLA